MTPANIERKIVLIGRHGEAPQKPEGGSLDMLTKPAFDDLYLKGRSLKADVEEHGYTPERTFLVHTPKQRTMHTGLIILVGAYDMKPAEGRHPPKSAEDLDNYEGLSRIDTHADPRLIYGHPFGDREDGNMILYKESGALTWINHWIANPNTEYHEGVKSVPGSIAMTDIKECTAENLKRILEGQKDLGVIISHATRAEAAIINLINSGRHTPVGRIEEFSSGEPDDNGTFRMGEYSRLIIDMSKGNVLGAYIDYKGQKYNVDMKEFMNMPVNTQ
ncbi:MAG: hypothetical protein KKE20_05350 [Nanoarchaeota archaeon]|nr:hypothetical protein [Nanoarchaeota archaeon]